MAYVFSSEIDEDGSSKLSLQGARSSSIETSHVNYYVMTNDIYEGWADVKVATNLPRKGITVLNGQVCDSIEGSVYEPIRRNPTTGVPCTLWKVKVGFTNQIESGTGGGTLEPTNPLMKRPEISWVDEDAPGVITEDSEGTQLMTTAKEPIIVEGNRTIAVLTIARYEAYPFNPQTIFLYKGTTNLQTFYGAPKGRAFMAGIQSNEEIIDNKVYCKVVYRIKFDPNTPATSTIPQRFYKFSGATWVPMTAEEFSPWDIFARNSGYNYLPAVGQKPTTGGKTGSKVKFDLKADGTVIDPTTDPVLFLRFKRIQQNFGNLNLGPF